MRVLLDECVPRRFKLELPEFDVSTVRDEGWTSQRNGDLLREMVAAGFTVFVTMDRNLMHQQNVSAGGIAVFVLRAASIVSRTWRPSHRGQPVHRVGIGSANCVTWLAQIDPLWVYSTR